MSDDCPSFLQVGSFLFTFILSAATLLYIFIYSSFLLSRFSFVEYSGILASVFIMGYSGYKIYKSLFPGCWI
jgi:hypothetical protein